MFNKGKQKKLQSIIRSQSLANVSQRTTIAQFNRVSIRITQPLYKMNKPVRIVLPQFFNVPSFSDKNLSFQVKNVNNNNTIQNNFNNSIGSIDNQDDQKFQQNLLKKRIKDLSILAQGMKRSKNIKQQSRYYFIQGVMLQNAGQYAKAINLFDKFLKIVLFIKDQKSVQLALNAIGCCYMYSNEFQKAIQYHVKQTQIISLSDQFIGRVNSGLCYQLMGKHDDARRQYQQALNFQKNKKKNPKRIKVQQHMLSQQMFLTQKATEKIKQSSILKNNSNSQQKSKKIYLGKMQKSPNRKQYQNAKIGYAVCKAQQSIDSYIQTMRNSLSLDQKKFKTEQNSF